MNCSGCGAMQAVLLWFLIGLSWPVYSPAAGSVAAWWMKQ